MLNRIAKSKSFDIVGVVIIFVCAFFSGYLFETLQSVTHWGAWSMFVPFGIISAVGSGFSVISDRLTARMKNLGNWLGLVAVITSGTVDYLLGNKGAIYTYPLTFIIQAVAIKHWLNSDKYKASKPLRGVKGLVAIVGVTVVSVVFSYWVNGLGFTQHNALFYLTVLVFASSLVANVLNAMKLSMQWPFWIFYNVVQLGKAVVQGNFANVGKYIYYLINCAGGISVWVPSRKNGKSVKNARPATAK